MDAQTILYHLIAAIALGVAIVTTIGFFLTLVKRLFVLALFGGAALIGLRLVNFYLGGC